MAKPELVAVRDSRVPALAMANRFSKYAPESERTVRKAEVAEDEALRQLKMAWKAFDHDFDHYWADSPYDSALDAIESLHYSASDVERFSLALAEFQGVAKFQEKAGVFLSALVNEGRDADYIVHTGHLAAPPHFLGLKNTKSITIEGNVGEFCGEEMRRGEIRIDGEIGSFGGIYGGKIYHKGELIADR